MDTFKTLIYEANKSFNTADHLAYVTYNIVKDTKVISLISEHLLTSLTKGMDALLYIEREYKRISQYPDSFEIKLELFKKIIKRYGISKDYIEIIKELKEIKEYKQKGPVSFTKKDKLVMYSSNYRLKTVTLDKIKKHISQTKAFIQLLNIIQDQYENRFRR